MAKISAKNSNLKTIANKIIVSPSTAAVSDLKFKRRKDFSTFVKWIESSNKALAGIKLPSKKEVEKLGKGSGGGFPWLFALLGLAGLGALGIGKLAKGAEGEGDEKIDNVQKVLKQDEIRTATDFSGRIPREINVKNVKNIKVNPNKVKVKPSKIKSSTLKTLNKGTKPKVVNTGTKGGKFTSTPGKAPTIPKKVVPQNKLVQSVTKPFKQIRLDKGIGGVARHGLTVAGRVLAVADAAHTTVDRLQEGQTVNQAVVGATAETAGSWYGFGGGFKLGSAVTGKIALPLLTIPKVGWVAYPLVTLAGGIAGGYAGSKIGRSMAGGLADKFTGVLNKAQAANNKKSVTEKKKDENNITSGETTIPVPIITSGDNNGTTIPVPIGDVGSNNTSSSSAAVPFDSGLNNTLSDLLLTNLK
tara:strand:+ start:1515 stop:2759 length:1245 start_codon:yes stop_codon:yes gene_type:complete